MQESPHEIVNPPDLIPPVGFSHAVVAAPGRSVYLGGQTGHNAQNSISDDLVEQFCQAAANVVIALEAARARPEHLTSLQVFVTSAATYRERLEELGSAYQRHLGKHYPAMALFEVAGLFDPRAQVELVAVAVIPE